MNLTKLDKEHLKKSTLNIKMNEKLKVFQLRSATRQGFLHHTSLFKILLEVLNKVQNNEKLESN